MIKITVPATSANLGPGFDTMGLALNIFNSFYVEKSDRLAIENVPEEFRNRSNLFVKAYDITLAKKNKKADVYVKFETEIPISRGLGSSSTLVVAGVLAANYLHDLNLSMQEMLNICNDIEGHPDNVAPCLLGGFVSTVVDEGIPYSKRIDIDKKFFFTVMVPDFEVKTADARAVMPKQIKISDAVYSLSRAISLCFALKDGDEEKVKVSFDDKIHEPYRRLLIPDYEELRKEVLKKGALAFLISGSGSTCLVISTDREFSKKIKVLNLKAKWKFIDCVVHEEEARIEYL
ncbi:MAG: homoserine kinase [Fusobacterium gastrosuis]|uniref:homoserine kinase n=1 Tax=Fusobacterium gastrosuis TaxID=1755100 RepID=UPI002A859F3C|nr:homoserine kinase [Fusobacterium gastrosuis]